MAAAKPDSKGAAEGEAPAMKRNYAKERQNATAKSVQRVVELRDDCDTGVLGDESSKWPKRSFCALSPTGPPLTARSSGQRGSVTALR